MQLKIVSTAETFLSWAITTKPEATEWRKEREKNVCDMQQAVEHNCKRAAEVQLAKLHQTVSAWKKQHNIVVEKTCSINITSFGARQEFIEGTYFKQWLGPKNKNVYFVPVLPSLMSKIDKILLMNEILMHAELSKGSDKILKKWRLS